MASYGESLSVHKKGRINMGNLIHAPHDRFMHKLIYKYIIS